MPATRAQRQCIQQRRHARLPDELVRKIIETAGPYCVLVKGGQACSLEIPRTAGRTAKSFLAPVSNNLLRVPEDHTSIADAVAAARDGHTILVRDDQFIEIDRVITVPPIQIQIVGIVNQAMDIRYGTTRDISNDARFLQTGHADLRAPHPRTPYICGSFDRRAGGGDDEDGGVFWVDGAGARLTLRNITFLGVSVDDDDFSDDEDAEVDLASRDTGIMATDGAHVVVENRWFSCFGRGAIAARSGARVDARDCSFGRSYFGACTEGAGSSMVLERCDFLGTNMYAVMSTEGGRIDVRSCRVAGSTMTALAVSDAGSRLRFDASTVYRSRRARLDDMTPGQLEANGGRPFWIRRALALDGGSLTFPDRIPGAQVEGDTASPYGGPMGGAWLCPSWRPGGEDDLYVSDDEWPGDDDPTTAGVRWLTVTHDHWETGREASMHD